MTTQHMTALQLANEVRHHKSRTKRLLAALPRAEAMEAAAALITAGEERDGSWRITELVSAIPGIRASRARDLARHAMASPDAQLRRLSERQRGALADGLRNPQTVWPNSRMRMGEAA